MNIEKDQFPHRGPSNGNTVGAGLSLSYLFKFPRPPHYNVVVVDKMSFSIQKDLLTERGKLYLDILPNDPMEMKQALIDFKNAERIKREPSIDAITLFHQARLLTHSARLLARAGRLDDSETQWNQVVANLSELINLDPTFRRRITIEPLFKERINNHEFVELLQKAESISLSKSKNLAEVKMSLGRELARNGRLEESLEAYYDAVQADRSSTLHRSNLARAYLAVGKHDPAIEQYEAAIYLNSSYASAYCNLALLYKSLLMTDYAHANWEECVRFSPKSGIRSHAQKELKDLDAVPNS